jgi:hypothetical protein
MHLHEHTTYCWHNKKAIMLHQFVIQRMGLIVPSGHEIDHEDRNKLNNQRYNLRIVTRGHNNLTTNSLGCKGVHETPAGNYALDFRGEYVGTFKTIAQAIDARKQLELEHYGEVSPD